MYVDESLAEMWFDRMVDDDSSCRTMLFIIHSGVYGRRWLPDESPLAAIWRIWVPMTRALW